MDSSEWNLEDMTRFLVNDFTEMISHDKYKQLAC